MTLFPLSNDCVWYLNYSCHEICSIYVNQYWIWAVCFSRQCLGSRHVGYRTAICWGTDLSAPQQIGVGEPTGRLSGVGVQTCRFSSKLPLGSRQVGYLALGSRPVGSPANCRWGADRSDTWRWGADLSAPQQIAVGEPTGRLSGVGEQTCRLPSKLPLGSRQVGSPANCRLPRHSRFSQFQNHSQ